MSTTKIVELFEKNTGKRIAAELAAVGLAGREFNRRATMPSGRVYHSVIVQIYLMRPSSRPVQIDSIPARDIPVYCRAWQLAGRAADVSARLAELAAK